MKTYDAYKESENDAIGLIPSDWNITSIKNILEIPITDGPHTTPEFYDVGIPFLSAEAVKRGKLDFNRKRGFISKEDFNLYSQKYAPKRGDIFMVKSGATTGNTAMVETDEIFNIWSPLAVFRANKQKIIPKYLHYYLMSPNFKSLVELSWSYGTQQNIGMGVLSNLSISYPNTETQTQIAKYLDYQTGLIDAIIEKKELLMEKLKQQRQAIINEAVTKGLNPNAPMKDSGIEWLGEIPEHWEIVKLKYISDVSFSSVDRHQYEEELKVNICHYPDAYRNDKILSKTKLSSGTCTVSEFEKYQLKEGQVLITKDSESADDIGVPTYITQTFKNSVCGYHLAILLTDNTLLLGEFLFRFLQSKNVKSFFETNANGVTRFGLGKSTIENLYVPKFDLKEQKEIIFFINSKTEQIDLIMIQVKLVIKKLKSYRQSIISEAVTGKIDVRDWQPKTNKA